MSNRRLKDMGKEYFVTLPEVWSQKYSVIAGSPKEALSAALDGDGSPIGIPEYERPHERVEDCGITAVSDEDNFYFEHCDWKESAK